MLNTVDLAYDSYGRETDPSVIILHGFFAASRNWSQIARKLSERFHVHVLDLRNHGRSPHAEAMDYPVMAADVARFIETHGLNPILLIGHSMGGKVAMWLALTCPERLRNLLVVDIAPVSYEHSFGHVVSALDELPLDAIHNRREALSLLSRTIPDQVFCQFLLQNLILEEGTYQWRIDLGIFARNQQNIPAFPQTDGMKPFSGRVLFVAGGNSNHIRPEHRGQILDLFPVANIVTIPDTGHWLHAEKPEAFMQTVVQFIDGESGVR